MTSVGGMGIYIYKHYTNSFVHINYTSVCLHEGTVAMRIFVFSGQTVQVMVSWLVVALVITVNSNPVNSIMTNCNCGSGDTSLEVQMDMIRNLNRSAQDALNFYLVS